MPLFMFTFFYVPVWSTFIILTTCMISIYMKIRRLEHSMLEYRPSHGHAKAFAFQASMYVGAFFMSWSVSTSASLLYIIAGKGFFWQIFVGLVLVTSQGFFNMIVYKLPEYQRYRRKKRRESDSRQLHHGSEGRLSSYSSRSFRYIFSWIQRTSDDENASNQSGEVMNIEVSEQHFHVQPPAATS
jgi:hypothetical protein